tara:strand:+ start:144 stop:575 length:432 start_codon:yes stop_codon:yes gene_type:complete
MKKEVYFYIDVNNQSHCTEQYIGILIQDIYLREKYGFGLSGCNKGSGKYRKELDTPFNFSLAEFKMSVAIAKYNYEADTSNKYYLKELNRAKIELQDLLNSGSRDIDAESGDIVEYKTLELIAKYTKCTDELQLLDNQLNKIT